MIKLNIDTEKLKSYLVKMNDEQKRVLIDSMRLATRDWQKAPKFKADLCWKRKNPFKSLRVCELHEKQMFYRTNVR